MISDKELEYASRLSDAYCKSYNRNYQKQEDIRKSLISPRIDIKKDLLNSIKRNIDLRHIKNINVLCSSFGFNYLHTLIEIANVNCYDVDPYVLEISWSLFKHYEKKPLYINQDIWKDSNILDSDLNIFPSCEHLPPIKYWEGFKQGLYVFSTTNFSDIKDHNNIVDSIQEFEDQMPDMLDIILSEEKEYEGYGKQYTIIGKMC